MTTSFTVISGNSVPSNYSWDKGTPFSSTSPAVSTNLLPVNNIITGYAPGVKIFFKNNSSLSTTTTTTTAISSLYSWDFGDYYNHQNNNYTTPCSGNISHTYIMPGTYTATLTRYETLSQYIPKTDSTREAQIIINTITEITPPVQVCVVNEITPVAGLTYIGNFYGTAPLSVRLTSRTTKAGSLPIDKIVWDFGDGSPLLTVSRYATAENSFLIKSGAFNLDPEDPRNYDPIHIYQRSFNTYAVFYPSITAYSSSTNICDTCSIPIGPIYFPSINQINVLKSKQTSYGSFHAIEVNNNISFIRTLSSTNTQTINPTTPPNPIRDFDNQTVLYNGNPGSDYYSASIVC